LAKDLAAARHWYQKAAAAGDALAMNNLGAMLNKGEGGPKDAVEARRWYEKSSALGYKLAKENLANMDAPSPRRTATHRRGGRARYYNSGPSRGPCTIFRPYGYGNVEVKSAGCY
jgi:TPR repeat protein